MARIKSWTEFKSKPLEEQKRIVIEYRESGMTDTAISKALGVQRGTFYHWKTQNNMQRSGVSKSFPKKMSTTLCWTCKKYGGGCNWSRDFEPVEGWEAIETAPPTFLAALNKMVPNIAVVSCPEYVEG